MFEKRTLQQWKFALGETPDCLKNGCLVRIPHTWNIEDGREEFRGTGWYETELEIGEEWKNEAVRLYFHAAYHDARIYLNGEFITEHMNSGYTPFWADLTGKLVPGVNRVTVSVNNEFSPDMLPVNRSFDWSNDGGLIRPVELYVTGRCHLDEVKVHAKPVITTTGRRQDEGDGIFGLEARLTGNPKAGRMSLNWALYQGCDNKVSFVDKGMMAFRGEDAVLDNMILQNVSYWHFDAPNLYTVKLELKCGGKVLEEKEITFGFRDFHVQGREFFLNGEPVRLCGTEWMPGSDPAYGSAETKEQIEKMLRCLKGSNSIYTRFHWQQDDWVFDWCDRHGILVQEEVPFWGKDPEKATKQQLDVFRMQMEEMIKAHRHHPSIVTWGVGNELDGQSDETIQYIKDAVAYTHQLDPHRTAVYVSNTCFADPGRDGTTAGDIMMINDYIGTWFPDLKQDESWDSVVKLNPDKPMVPSEFGLCEPAFSGGDTRRGQIFLEKMACYRKYDQIAGTIYFCLNDYRTQMGEEGKGKLCRRVHGSVDLYGEPKPSYHIVKKEYAPIEWIMKDYKITLTCKDKLPRYEVKGYVLKVDGRSIKIPALRPGESWTSDLSNLPDLDNLKEESEIVIYRPTGEDI